MTRTRSPRAILCLVAAAALATGPGAWAQGRGGPPQGRGWGPPGRFVNDDPAERERESEMRRERPRQCRDEGTGGTILGAIAGGLLGGGVARGDRALGALVGGGAGALAGRALDRDC